MPFLVLNGTTIRAKSNAVGEKNFEHRVDRFRTFGGQVRQTTGGQFREWDITSQCTEANADILIALLKSTSLPLAMTGDLCKAECAVMPVFVSNDPVHTAEGFRRLVVYRLLETPTPVPADTSAVPWLFWRRAIGMFQLLDGTIASGSGDPLGYWTDQSGNARHHIATQITGPDTRPTNDAGAALFPDGTPWLNVPFGFHLLESAEIMMRLRAEEDPPLSGEALHCRLHNLGGSGISSYPALDAHIFDGFGSQDIYDIGDPSDDLTNWNVVSISSDPVTGYTYRLNGTVLFTKSIAGGHVVDFGLGVTDFRVGGGLPNVNDSWFGRASDVLITEPAMNESQRNAWNDYMTGATGLPPIA